MHAVPRMSFDLGKSICLSSSPVKSTTVSTISRSKNLSNFLREKIHRENLFPVHGKALPAFGRKEDDA